MLELAKLGPPILGARAYDSVGEPHNDQEGLGAHVDSQPFLVVFSWFLKDAVQAVVEAQMGSTWPDDDVED